MYFYPLKLLRLLLIILIIFTFSLRSSSAIVAQSAPEKVKVLVIAYIPPDPNRPDYPDPQYVGHDLAQISIADLKTKINNLDQQLIQVLTEGTKYKGYSNPSAQPNINYEQVGSVVVELQPHLRSGFSAGGEAYNPDYAGILTKANICEFVDNQSVEQVWLWGYHYGDVAPAESNMSMSNAARAFWNRDGYGDVSNSYQYNDLSVCNHTYTLFHYNYDRGLGEAVEDHLHQLERLFQYLDNYNQPANLPGQSLFWNLFVGAEDGQSRLTSPGCGWTHYPPNGTQDYDWYNQNSVQSDCMDWKPDRSGQKSLISCSTWNGCQADQGVKFKIWWMQNIPGLNNGLTFRGKSLKNWWKAVYDFEGMLLEGEGLLQSNSTENQEPHDLNNDGLINLDDFDLLVSKFGLTVEPNFTKLDIVSNGVVDIYDYNNFLEKYSELHQN